MKESPIFKAEFTPNVKTFPEISSACANSMAKYYWLRVVSIAAFAYYIYVLIVTRSPYPKLPYYCLLFVAVWLIMFFATRLKNRGGGLQYKRMASLNDGVIPRTEFVFSQEESTIWHSDSNSTRPFPYSHVVSLIQSEHYLVLMLEHKQYFALDKSTLSGGTLEEFTDFLLRMSPQIKPKRIRSNLPGKLLSIIMYLSVAAVGVLSVTRLPVVQNAIENCRQINNSMSYAQIADALAEYDITVTQAQLDELEEYDAFLKDSGISITQINKVAQTLSFAGYGTYSESTWEWTPSSSGVYWFDTEVFDVSCMYTNFLRGISALDPEELNFTNIQEDTSDVDWQTGSGTYHISFDWNGSTYHLEGKANYDWFDLRVAQELAKIIRQQSGDAQLYFASDDLMSILVFYRSEAWVKKFESATGLDLQTSVSQFSY